MKKYIMIKSVMSFRKFLTILPVLFLASCPMVALAETVKFGVGTSYMYANINDKDFEYVDEYGMLKRPLDQLQNISVSSTVFYDNGVNVSLSTNRLINKEISRTVRRKSDGVEFISDTQTTIDSMVVSYKMDRFNPGLLLANVREIHTLYYGSTAVGYRNRHAIVGGANLGYFVNKHFVPSVSYILPNAELGLESAFSLNFNFLF